jgi:hypothetical protein
MHRELFVDTESRLKPMMGALKHTGTLLASRCCACVLDWVCHTSDKDLQFDVKLTWLVSWHVLATAGPYEDLDGLVFPESGTHWLDTWQRAATVSCPDKPSVVILDTLIVDGKPKLGGNSGRVFQGALYFGHAQFEWLMGQFLLVQQVQSQLPKGQYLFELIQPQSNGLPVISASGKYAVKLHIYDGWRTVIVDDRVPLDLFGRPLVVATRPFQLWPILLSKALLKVMAAYHILERQAPHHVRIRDGGRLALPATRRE